MDKELAALYGRGAGKRFREAFAHNGPARFSRALVQPDGSIWFDRVEWSDGSDAALQCWPNYVHWATLHAHTKGLYDRLATGPVAAMFEELGVTHYTCSPTDEGSRAALAAKANWKQMVEHEGDMVLDLADRRKR